MFELVEMLLRSRGALLVIVFVIVLVVFTTGGRRPSPRCPRCQDVNRPMARYCAHCGQQLFKS